MASNLAVLVYAGVADWELSFPLFCWHPEIDHTFVGLEGGRIRTVMGFELEPEPTLETLEVGDFAGLYLPGGLDPVKQRFPRSLGENHLLLGRVREFHDQGKVLAAICGAPLILGAAGLLDGRVFASDVTEDTRGWFDRASRSKASVHTDGKIVTGSVSAMISFAAAVARALGEDKTAGQIEEFFST